MQLLALLENMILTGLLQSNQNIKQTHSRKKKKKPTEANSKQTQK